MILNIAVAKALARAQLVISVKEPRPADDPFQLPEPLRLLVANGKDTLEADNISAMDVEGERAGASALARAAYDKIKAAVRAGYAGISALLSDDLSPTGISDAQRLEVYTSYGWSSGEIGRFTDSRLLVLAELAVSGPQTITNPDYRYSDNLVDLIEEQLAILEAEEPEAETGDRQVAVDTREDHLRELEIRLSRVRYHYCSASDKLDTTPELARIGFQPRRPRGSVNPPPPPTPPTP